MVLWACFGETTTAVDRTWVTNRGFDNKSPIEGLGGFPNSERSVPLDGLVVDVVLVATMGDASGAVSVGDGDKACGCGCCCTGLVGCIEVISVGLTFIASVVIFGGSEGVGGDDVDDGTVG